MQSVIKSIFVLFLLGFSAIASAQLPPEVIADKYLIQAEQLLAKKDYVAALNMMDKILVLQKEHNITLLDEFHFKYAHVPYQEIQSRSRRATFFPFHCPAWDDRFIFYPSPLNLYPKESIEEVSNWRLRCEF